MMLRRQGKPFEALASALPRWVVGVVCHLLQGRLIVPQPMTLTIFGVPTARGIDLIQRATALGQRLGYTVSVVDPVNQWALVCAAFSSDVVLFDGTIEDEQQHIYHAGALIPAAVDHLLVVGRSYLPINFIPARRGGAPDYPCPHFDPQLDASRHWQSWSNDNVAGWLERQLVDFKNRGLRRKDVDIVALAATNDPEQIGRAMVDFYRASEPHVDVADRVFVSYRSRLWQEEVEPLKGRLERGELHGGQRKTVEVLEPGALAYEGELLTAMRRWQLLSLIDRLIAQCAEMIIYRSNDYLDSWWTRGEVVTLAYRRGSGSESQPVIRIYDPERDPGRLTDAPAELMPVVSEPQLRRMARWYAHTDPHEIGPENVGFCRMIHKVIRYVPNALLGLAMKAFSVTDYARMMTIVGGALGGEEHEAATRRQMVDPALIKEFFSDEIWSDAFWDEVLLECPRHRAPRKDGGLDLAGFLSARPTHMIGLNPDQMAKAISRGAIACPRCAYNHAVVAAPPRYLWAPLRHGQTRTETQTGLMRLDTYVALPGAAT